MDQHLKRGVTDCPGEDHPSGPLARDRIAVLSVAMAGRRQIGDKPVLASVLPGLAFAAILFAVPVPATAADCSASPRPAVDWSQCNRSNLMMSGADLKGANLKGADLSLTDLRDTALASADLQDAKLVRSSLAGAVADAANFTKAEGYRTNFSGISAKGASFRSAELQRADFKGANLTGGNFDKAELGRAHFEGAVLADNSFSFANLARADFRQAEIGGALNFTGAYMFLTRIDGADLSAATGLQQAQIDLTCGDASTKLPSGLKPAPNWPCDHD